MRSSVDSIVIETPKGGGDMLAVYDADTNRMLGLVKCENRQWQAIAAKRRYLRKPGAGKDEELITSPGFGDRWQAGMWLAERADSIGY